MEKRTDFNIGDHVFVWKDNEAVMRIIEDIIITPCLDIKKGAKWPCTNFVLQGEKKLCGANIVGRTPEEARLNWSIAFTRRELGEWGEIGRG